MVGSDWRRGLRGVFGHLRGYALAALSAVLLTATAAASGLTYLVHEPTAGPAHPPLIVLLHGAGADERDMIGLWRQLPADFVVVSPRAPFGDAGGGYRWYRRGTGREADIAISRKIVDLVIGNAMQRFDADPQRVFIGGFSQGAAMVYEVALREPDRFRGAVVLSGSMFPSEASALPTGVDRSREAFFIGHGTADPRIPFGAATTARAVLTRLGVPTAFHAYTGMRHETGEAEIRDLAAWLEQRRAEAPNGAPK